MEESIQWKALEFEYKEKNADWYWTLGIVAVAGTLIAIILGNVLFAILIIIATFTVALYASKHPKLIDFEMDARGIRAGHTLHPFSTLESFWIEEEHEGSLKLLLISKKTFALQIIIPLVKTSAHDIREYLNHRLPEVEQHESFTERIMEFVRF
ncbi:hypothetical protein IIC45_00675 [Patescibacteria group bacterium]|nr:hypothetical protein [Patescibacteria group bacterium]